MGQPQIIEKNLTIEEWVELEQSGEVRYEYHFGEVFAMAGGSFNHGTIGQNAFFEIEANFRASNKNCRAFSSDFKIEIEQSGRYVYPDTLAVCGDPEESKKVKGAIVNPVLVVEVTSKSSESYDRISKFDYYTNLPSLKQYMIASQAGPYVTVYNKNEATGKFDIDPFEVRGLEGVIDLFSVHLQLPMTALYRNVEFDKTSTHLHPVKK